MDPEHPQWREEHFSSWSNLVMSEIEKNITYREEKNETVDVFRNITCPFQCNFNGDCVNGM